MSKALVIKGANFSANKLTTVELDESIPCTGITLSDDSITFSVYEDTETLTATVTPADTTDNVVWSSSDTNVATVSGGVVKCVGIGTATITASCGTQSATCTVSVSSVMIDFSKYSSAAGYTIAIGNDAGNYITPAAEANGAIIYSSENVLGGYKALYGATDFSDKYAIPLPKGATKLSGAATTNGTWINVGLLDTDTQATSHATGGTYSAKRVFFISKNKTIPETNISSYTDAKGFLIGTSNASDTITITFS